MSLRVNTNVAALNAYRNLSVTDSQMAKSLEKLSSGFRINRAGDDAAGLVISESLRSQVGGLKVAVRNAQDGISVVQTAEGALTEVHSMLQRMRDLTVQGANDSNDTTSRTAIKAELTQLSSAIDDIATRTKFNGTALLSGTATTLNFQVGANNGEVLAVTTGDMSVATLGVADADLVVTDNAASNTTLGKIDAAISSVSAYRGTLGASQNRFEHTISNLQVTQENLTASESRIRDTDMAQEMSMYTRSQILQQAGTAMLAQANSSSQSVLQLLRG